MKPLDFLKIPSFLHVLIKLVRVGLSDAKVLQFLLSFFPEGSHGRVYFFQICGHSFFKIIQNDVWLWNQTEKIGYSVIGV